LYHPRVLVVDDDTDTRELYRIMLEAVGYRVESAGTVRAAAQRLAGAPPHVIVTDWLLPDGDGFSVAAALRAHQAWRHIPIVAITGISMTPAMASEASERGFTSVLIKPASPDDILSAVRFASELGTAWQLRAAAQRLRRYAARAARAGHQSRETAAPTIDTRALMARAAARSGDNIALMLADEAGHYVAAAGSARELTGYEPQELLSLSVWDLTPPSDVSSGEGLWSSFIASGRQEGRYLLRRRDGQPIEAQYCAIANIVPGLHVSAIAAASQMPASL
jgi:PAS domain S-box-containing protein